MENHNFNLKLIVIFSDNSIIYDALIDNIRCDLELINQTNIDKINSYDKIDILIIDYVSDQIIPLHRINILINCTQNQISSNEISLHKPLKLAELIDVINRNQQDKNLFCCINKEWIYNQQLSLICSADQSISLTNRENDIFKELLNLDNFSAEKEHLLKEVWNYHKDTESNTVETHLYKLKQKLPSGLLEIRNSSCFLAINDIRY